MKLDLEQIKIGQDWTVGKSGRNDLSVFKAGLLYGKELNY